MPSSRLIYSFVFVLLLSSLLSFKFSVTIYIYHIICTNDPLCRNGDPCDQKFYEDLGLIKKGSGFLVVNDWISETYKTIRSIFISSPCPYYHSTILDDDNNDHDDEKKKLALSSSEKEDIENISLAFAVRRAYKISLAVRKYLNAVDKTKIPIWDIASEKNPRLWPIIWRMLYNEPLLVSVDKGRLIFEWSQIII